MMLHAHKQALTFYDSCKVRAAYLKRVRKWDADQMRDDFWQHHHTWAGEQFYSMAIDLRGFYLKVLELVLVTHCQNKYVFNAKKQRDRSRTFPTMPLETIGFE